MSLFEMGMTNEVRLQTGPQHSARTFFPRLPDAFATPFLAGLMETASAELMAEFLQEGEQSVGISMNLKHMAPTPLGMEVRVVTVITKIEGKKLTFSLEAFDEKEKIGEAVHERFIINADKFMQKVNAKGAS